MQFNILIFLFTEIHEEKLAKLALPRIAKITKGRRCKATKIAKQVRLFFDAYRKPVAGKFLFLSCVIFTWYIFLSSCYKLSIDLSSVFSINLEVLEKMDSNIVNYITNKSVSGTWGYGHTSNNLNSISKFLTITGQDRNHMFRTTCM